MDLISRNDLSLSQPCCDHSTALPAAARALYTTGTTGDPKGVCFSHRQIVLHALTAKAAVDRGELSRFARLDRVEVVPAMPRTSVGKIDKKLLR
jgi:acyl-CoA synthetase (AMP-forming)/AMP-acid ligase II